MSKFMLSLHARLMADRSNTDATASETISLLSRLAGKPFSSLKFLTDTEKVIAALGPAESTKKKQLGKIVAVLSFVETSPIYRSAAKVYRGEFDDKTVEIAKTVADRGGALSAKEKESFMIWPDVLKRYAVLTEAADTIAKKKLLTADEFKVLQAHAFLALYVLIPPRRNKDYQEMYVVRKLPDPIDTAKNYYVLSEQKMYFNTFKTAKALGSQVVDVPTELGLILNRYLKFNMLFRETKGKLAEYPLVVGQSGIRLKAANTLTYVLAAALDKAAGSNMLRHSYLSHKFGPTTVEMAEVAQAMAHSVSTQAGYIRHVPDPDVVDTVLASL